jgi:hypothetical protein
MFKTIVTASVALVALVASAAAQDKPKTPNYCKAFAQADCVASKACGWKESETWTRTSDGKVRLTKAVCRYDAKAAKALMFQQVGQR